MNSQIIAKWLAVSVACVALLLAAVLVTVQSKRCATSFGLDRVYSTSTPLNPLDQLDADCERSLRKGMTEEEFRAAIAVEFEEDSTGNVRNHCKYCWRKG